MSSLLMLFSIFNGNLKNSGTPPRAILLSEIVFPKSEAIKKYHWIPYNHIYRNSYCISFWLLLKMHENSLKLEVFGFLTNLL